MTADNSAICGITGGRRPPLQPADCFGRRSFKESAILRASSWDQVNK